LKVRYVGITKSKIEKRLISHISEARAGRTKNTYKNNWIKSILKVNSKPYIRLLASFNTREEAAKMETELIFKYREKHKLTNCIVDEGKFTSEGDKSASKLLAKKLYIYDYSGNFIKEGGLVKDTAKELGIYPGTISKCLRGEIKSAKGYQFSREKVDKMLDLNNYSHPHYVETELLDTLTNKIYSFPSRKDMCDFLDISTTGSNLKNVLAPINLKYGNRYKVKCEGKWKQSTYYNTGVIVYLDNEILKFETKQQLAKLVGLQGGFKQEQLDKFVNKHFDNLNYVEYRKPLNEVIC